MTKLKLLSIVNITFIDINFIRGIVNKFPDYAYLTKTIERISLKFIFSERKKFKDSKLQMNFEIASDSNVMTAMNVIIHNGLRNSLA